MACGVAIACLTLAAADPSRASSDGLSPWRHGITSPKADAGFTLMAARRGFARSEGLALELVRFREDNAGIEALLAGDIDSYEGNPGAAMRAAAHGAPVRIIGCPWHAVPQGLFARLGINRPADLAGATVGIAATGSLPDLILRTILTQAKMSFGDMKTTQVVGDRERYTALIGGSVDAAVVSSEYLPLPSSKGIKLIVEGRVAMPEMVRTCIITTVRNIAAREDEAVRFLAARMRGLRYALANPAETARLAFESSDMRADDPRPNFMARQAAKPDSVVADLAIPVEKLGWMRDHLAQLGDLDRPVDIGRLVEPSLRLKALERLR